MIYIYGLELCASLTTGTNNTTRSLQEPAIFNDGHIHS